MNWLAQYFEQRTNRLTLSLWAYPPLVLGPDGPVAQPVIELAYPGGELVYTPGAAIEQAGCTYTLPPHFDMVRAGKPSPSTRAGDEYDTLCFERVSIYAPSAFNPEFLVTVNDAMSFVPIFAADGSPVFFGVAQVSPTQPMRRSQTRLPWVFRGYISI